MASGIYSAESEKKGKARLVGSFVHHVGPQRPVVVPRAVALHSTGMQRCQQQSQDWLPQALMQSQQAGFRRDCQAQASLTRSGL
jgi:hypothetical protein